MNAGTDHLRTLVLEHADKGTALPPLSEELVRSLDLPSDVGTALTIAEVSELTGVTVHTLRYYERIGLGRVIFIARLRMSDMPIRVIQRYIGLVEQGESTVPERLDLLNGHRASIQSRMGDLQWTLAVVDYKITTYGGHRAP